MLKRLAIIAVGCLMSNAADVRTVVFVCEHGAAKSVVAAAEFNRLAGQRHLPYRAIARGTDPQAEVSRAAADGLRRDGLALPIAKPQKLSEADLASAARVITFCDLPAALASKTRAEHWDAPAVSDGYENARDTILREVKILVSNLPGIIRQ